MQNLRTLPVIPIALLFAWVVLPAWANPTPRPNIVVIMADDMGMENLSCYGSKIYQTPHIDALAASGIRFLHAHSQPLCTPSRVQIMTGLYNNRNYTGFGVLDSTQVTFANLLRDAGYATAIGGKWQLKGDYEGVKNFGFDRHCLWQLNRRPSRYANPGLEIDGERKDFKNGEFGPDVVNSYLRDFIRFHKGKEQPFLVYYPMMLPHWPFVPTPDHPDWDPKLWRDLTDEPRREFRTQKYWDAFVRYTDKMVGQLVTTLEETGQRDNTLILWTADNGTDTSIVSEFQGRPYRGGKGRTKDNGTHVGFIASWPKVIKPGQTSDALVDFSDVLPTLTEAAGIPNPAVIDGTSLLPVFQGKPEARKKDAIYCWYQSDGIRTKASQHTRDHRHKLYASGKFFDIVADPDEMHDLAVHGVPAELAEAHAKLKAALDRQLAITATAEKPAKKPSEPGRHLFILSGQSNMTGSLEAGFREVMHKNLGEGNVSIVRQNKPGRGIRFWVDDYDLPGDHPLHGSLKSGNGEEFPKLLAAARSAGDPKSFATVTFVWMQGESDANRNLSPAYAASFHKLLNRLKKELGIESMRFIIGRISDHGLHGDQAEGWKAMRKVQMELADSNPLGTWIDTDDLNGGDQQHPQGELHYPADQYPKLGARFAEAAFKQLHAPATPK